MKFSLKNLFNLRSLLILIILILVAGQIYGFLNPRPVVKDIPALSKKSLSITSQSEPNKKIQLTVEIAKTSQELELGLSNRNSLEPNSGMYFELPKRDFSTFWMKDMLIPLDIIWIDHGKIIGIEKNAQVPTNSSNIATFKSPSEVTNVLEVNGGFTDKNKITSGDLVKVY